MLTVKDYIIIILFVILFVNKYNLDKNIENMTDTISTDAIKNLSQLCTEITNNKKIPNTYKNINIMGDIILNDNKNDTGEIISKGQITVLEDIKAHTLKSQDIYFAEKKGHLGNTIILKNNDLKQAIDIGLGSENKPRIVMNDSRGNRNIWIKDNIQQFGKIQIFSNNELAEMKFISSNGSYIRSHSNGSTTLHANGGNIHLGSVSNAVKFGYKIYKIKVERDRRNEDYHRCYDFGSDGRTDCTNKWSKIRFLYSDLSNK